MDDIKETIAFLGTLFGPFLVWFSGKFLYNKWEKRKLDAAAESDEITNKQKEAELVVMYEGMARRAAEDAMLKSDRWQKLELFFAEKIKELESKIQEQDLKLKQQDSIILRMGSQITTLEAEKNTLTCENLNLKARVAFLEAEMNTRNGNC